MKKFILSALILSATAVGAAEVTVLEAELPVLRGRPAATAQFYMDPATGEGFAQIAVTEEEYVYSRPYYNDCYPYPYGGGYRNPRYPFPGGYNGPRCYDRQMPIPVLRTVLEETVRIENLVLDGDKVIYQGENGDIDCGKLGKSRIFKVPTLYLSGKCDLDARLLGSRNRGTKVVVKFKTK
jgi:hypothetical protein